MQGSKTKRSIYAFFTLRDISLSCHQVCLAVDAKSMRRVNRKDYEPLQQEFDKIVKQSHIWEIKFNKKNAVLEFGMSKRRLKGVYSMENEEMKRLKKTPKNNHCG